MSPAPFLRLNYGTKFYAVGAGYLGRHSILTVRLDSQVTSQQSLQLLHSFH